MKTFIKTRLLHLATFIIASATFLFAAPSAYAVPSFARQTGMACSACHTVFPELTSFGREFKLNGYTFTGLQQIQQPADKSGGGLKINETPPLSAMLVIGGTHLNKTPPDTQNNDIQFPQELSFFFAGEITPHIGSFLQVTYSQPDDHLGWDNADLRYANHTKLGDADTIYGLTLNNSPTVEDPWNSAAVWGFPFIGSETAPEAAAAPLVDGALAQDVAGLGGYALWNHHLYGNLTFYRSAHLGQGVPDATSSNTINGVAPYWRLAWQQNFGQNMLMVGTYGMVASLYPLGVSGNTDDYTDTAVDAQYEMPLGRNLLTMHTSYVHEKQKLNATDPGVNLKLDTFRLDGIYHWGNHATGALGYFDTKGDTNSNVWDTPSGDPDTNGWVAEADYLPWQNTKIGLQYKNYAKFDGESSNASDNNSLYLFGWFVW
jgi:hypothetical protein